MDNGIDWDALESELSEYESAQEAEDMYTLTDYYNARTPKAKETETTDFVKLGKDEDDIKEDDIVTEKDVIDNASILYPEEKLYRSILLEIFTPEQCLEIEKLSRTFSISNNKKVELLKEKLDSWNIEYSPLGPGTNRYAFMRDGYVVKVALDKDGKIDNKREFIYSLPLQPYVIKCYECCIDGLFAVFEYVEIFTIDDFWKNQDTMRTMLEDIAKNFLIGDVGISSANYVNWGFRDNGDLVILDYAYIYSVAFKKFTCTCSSASVLYYDKDFNNLICPVCGRKYPFKDIRKKISRKDQDEEIGDLREKGYVLSEPEEILKFNPKFVYGAFDRIFKKLIKMKKKQNERLSRSDRRRSIEEEFDSITMEDILNNIKTGKWRA